MRGYGHVGQHEYGLKPCHRWTGWNAATGGLIEDAMMELVSFRLLPARLASLHSKQSLAPEIEH